MYCSRKGVVVTLFLRGCVLVRGEMSVVGVAGKWGDCRWMRVESFMFRRFSGRVGCEERAGCGLGFV